MTAVQAAPEAAEAAVAVAAAVVVVAAAVVVVAAAAGVTADRGPGAVSVDSPCQCTPRSRR